MNLFIDLIFEMLSFAGGSLDIPFLFLAGILAVVPTNASISEGKYMETLYVTTIFAGMFIATGLIYNYLYIFLIALTTVIVGIIEYRRDK